MTYQKMLETKSPNDFRDCEKFLRMMQSMGTLVGDFYLLLGRAWEPPVKKPFAYRMGPKKECYRNAFSITQDFPELVYCEGFAMPAGLIPVHHAWCVTPEGLVVDPTWEGSGADYFGVALQDEFVLASITSLKVWGIFAEQLPRNVVTMAPEDYVHPQWCNSAKNLAKWRALVESKLSVR